MKTPRTFISTRTKGAPSEPLAAIPAAEPAAEGVEEVALELIPMPSSVRIGPFQHTIKPMDLMKSVTGNRIGEYDTMNLSIEILEEMPAQRRAETLMHELFHGMWHVTGLRGTMEEDEEHPVTVLSMAMCGLIRDNPELIAYLVQNLGDE